MRKLFVAAMMLLSSYAGFAQQVTVPEPEFVGGYCILTSDSTTDVLPKESGAIKKHESKFGKFSKIAGAASQLGFAGAMVGVSTSSLSGAVTGLRVAGTAAGVGVAADAVNTLAGAEGMDIAFEGGQSAHKIKDVKSGVRLVIKGENNDIDPMNLYRIVKFKASKKDRRIQWMEISRHCWATLTARKRDIWRSLPTSMEKSPIFLPFRHQSLNRANTAYSSCRSLRLRNCQSELLA